jgi:hypothetical protein
MTGPAHAPAGADRIHAPGKGEGGWSALDWDASRSLTQSERVYVCTNLRCLAVRNLGFVPISKQKTSGSPCVQLGGLYCGRLSFAIMHWSK